MDGHAKNGRGKRGLAGPVILLVAGLLVAGLGIGVVVAGVVAGIGSIVPEQRTAVPGTLTVDVSGGETVHVFAEARSEIDGRDVSGPVAIPGLSLSARDGNGEALPVNTSPAMNSTYMMPRFEGELIAVIPVGSGVGPVTVEAGLDGSPPAGTPVIAAKRASLGGLGLAAGGMLGGMLVFVAGMGLGLGGVIWLIVRFSGRGSG